MVAAELRAETPLSGHLSEAYPERASVGCRPHATSSHGAWGVGFGAFCCRIEAIVAFRAFRCSAKGL